MKQLIPNALRANSCTNQAAKKLFSIMDEKKSNLSIALDVTRAQELLALAERLGDYMVLLKTHVDLLDDFTPDLRKELLSLATRKNFLIFEDRKFADIGQTVQMQYEGGIYRIADFSHITNAHILPGPGIIEGLKKVGKDRGHGLLLLAEMSCSGNFLTEDYTRAAVSLAEQNLDFVIGFISMGSLSEDPRLLHMTPGIQLQEGKDLLGQRYKTPESAIESGSDVLIVGRGITHAQDPEEAAALYRKKGWEAYVRRLNG